MRDILAVIDHAARDPQVTRAVLVLDEMGAGGQATLREVAAALEKFKAAGKPVIAWGESFSQPQYYLAAQADEVYMHPGGTLTVHGMGGTRMYYKNLLDKLGVRINTFQAGSLQEFRRAVHPHRPDARGPRGRQLPRERTLVCVDERRRTRAQAAGRDDQRRDRGPAAATGRGERRPRSARGEEKLVDGLKTRDEFRRALLEAGAPPSDDEDETFRQISMYSYLGHVRPPPTGDAVGVIVAQGEIVGGDARQGRVGSTSTAELIQRARQDDSIKALVMRIDSPGGMVQPSDLIREQLDLTREAGKPVVVSMGDVAASGGYWIAMGGDEVFANAATITGSIGVFGIIPTFEGAAEKIGITTDERRDDVARRGHRPHQAARQAAGAGDLADDRQQLS